MTLKVKPMENDYFKEILIGYDWNKENDYWPIIEYEWSLIEDWW